MRITGGRAKGIVIRAPKGRGTRPTSDKVREAIFDTLAAQVPGSRVLDLFAGSGAMGIEALSREADFAVLVENDPSAARAIAENLFKAGLSGKAEILRADFRSALKRLGGKQERFDLVFIDPPYESGLLEKAVAALEKHLVASPNSVIVVEHFKKAEPPQVISGIPRVRTRHYGQTSVSYFQNADIG